MEAIRIIKTIQNDYLEELNQFRGEDVEIIILPLSEHNKQNKMQKLLSLKGQIKKPIDALEFQQKLRNEWEN